MRDGRFFATDTRARQFVAKCFDSPTKYLVRGFIRDGILGLTEQDFAGTLSMNNQMADEYGFIDAEGRPWYVKFSLGLDVKRGEVEVTVWSFHPPERPLQTRCDLIPAGVR